MKLKGLRKSKNIQDTMGPTGAYGRPSGMTRGITIPNYPTKTLEKSKMAKEAGIDNVEKAAAKKKKPTVGGGNVYAKSKRK